MLGGSYLLGALVAAAAHGQMSGPWLAFAAVMTAGSVTGALLGGLIVGVIPDLILIPALAAIQLISAVKLARHTAPS
ncbi:hypothetical protein Misp01_11260 [Microtetraspora sp. NBRC 13810]|uniref:hypothetical protein n=1 Tax=Microtetraspora sp. NBRC 13810 TaxID=3030990 RepID=UPI0024A2F2D3|nr:hypothetical protein [Microtetraspora sp. NBRC 13810]GLW05996.1 hypothetical protein Misp01_11260 [Microtetraspora sp. NBRC 13810]